MNEENKIKLNEMEFICGDFAKSEQFSEIVRDGKSYLEDQWIEFSSNGIPIIVRFDCEVEGYVDLCPGDYWTPPSSETVIEKIDIYITGFSIDESEIEVDEKLGKALKELVKNKIE